MDVRLPDGTLLQNVPDGISKADLTAKLASNGYDVSKLQTPPMSLMDMAGSSIMHIPESVGNFAGGIYQAVRHPIDTAKGLVDIGAGELQKIVPESVKNAVNSIDPNAEAAKQAEEKATQVNKFYKDRYGGVENIKKTIATDPVGIASDLSAVLSGGGAIASKLSTSKLANALRAGSDYTNPVNAITATAKGAKNLAGFGAKEGLGLTTGVGGEAISGAYNAGKEGNQAFKANLNGDVPMTDVLDTAKQSIANMKQARSAEYRKNMSAVTADKTTLDITPIIDKFNESVNTLKVPGTNMWKVGEAELKPLKEVQDVLQQWYSKPELHTAEGLDALKQRIDAIYPESPTQRQAQRVITGTRNAVKDTIVNQAPSYAKAMNDFGDMTDTVNEIERSLSLGNKASADTGMRKLQSLMRNNVQTNWSNRLDLADQLKGYGGQDILPALAGQSLNSWLPRGMTRMVEGGLAGGAAMTQPGALAMAPLASPRLMGNVVYGAGKVAGANEKLIQALRKVTPDNRAEIANLLSQAGQERK